MILTHLSFDSVSQGYQSTLARDYLKDLHRPEFGVHYRTLGDVAYFMCSLNTGWDTLREVEEAIRGWRRRDNTPP